MAPKRRVASVSPAPVATPPPGPSRAPAAPTPSAPVALSSKSSSQEIVVGVWQRYTTQTPQRILLLDTFMAFLVVVGAVQFVYCVLAGNYPFNAFLSGFSAAVGQFVLTASLRMQITSEQESKSRSKQNPSDDQPSEGTSSERAFADYVFGSILLHFFCVNFIN